MPDIELFLEENDSAYITTTSGQLNFFKWIIKKKLTKKIPKNSSAFNLKVTGLKGGHSGVDIHRGRGNANKLLFRCLQSISAQIEFGLCKVSGGDMRNAID